MRNNKNRTNQDTSSFELEFWDSYLKISPNNKKTFQWDVYSFVKKNSIQIHHYN